MPDTQKKNEISTEKIEKNRGTTFDKYKSKPYWSLKEGVNLLTPNFFSLRNCSPSEHENFLFILDDEKFDNLTRSMEVENDYISTPIEDMKKQIDECREYNEGLKKREDARGFRSQDFIILMELRENLFDFIKVKPALFIDFVKNNLALFPHLEAPLELDTLLDKKSNQRNTAGKTENKVPFNTIGLSNDEQLAKLFKIFCPEIEKFWSGFIKLLKRNTNRNIATSNMDEFKEHALLYYENNSDEFEYLKKEHIDSENFYEKKQNQKRATVGKILQTVVEMTLPEVAVDKKIVTNGNALFELAKKLIDKN